MEEGPSDEKITMLMCMGFGDITDIRRALKLAKNDINEAVAILTGEDSRSLYFLFIYVLLLGNIFTMKRGAINH